MYYSHSSSDHPNDRLVKSAFMAKFREYSRNTLWQSSMVKDELVPDRMTAEDYDESLAALMADHVLTGERYLGGQYGQLKVSPWAWFEDEEQHGVSVEAIRQRLLKAVVDGTTFNAIRTNTEIDWSGFSDVHWRTLHFVLDEFAVDGLFEYGVYSDQPHIRNVSPLAKRRLAEFRRVP